MQFTATQRCSECNSDQTVPMMECEHCKIKFPPPMDKHLQQAFTCPKCGGSDKITMSMSCQACNLSFKPCDSFNLNPILLCGPCGEPRPHCFVKNRPMRSLPVAGEPKGKLLYEMCIFVCDRGHERMYGRLQAHG